MAAARDNHLTRIKLRPEAPHSRQAGDGAGKFKATTPTGRLATAFRRTSSAARKAIFGLGVAVTAAGLVMLLWAAVTIWQVFGGAAAVEGHLAAIVFRIIGGVLATALGFAAMARGTLSLESAGRTFASDGSVADAGSVRETARREPVDSASDAGAGLHKAGTAFAEPASDTLPRDQRAPAAGRIVNPSYTDSETGASQIVIKVRCRVCRSLNDEDRETCEECGVAI